MKKHLLILIFFVPVFSQDDMSIETILDNISSHYSRIDDYSVRVKMSVEMPMFRMPRKRIDMYFKKPDKLKIESDGFAVVPRSGLTMSPDMFLSHIDKMTIRRDETGYIVQGFVAADSLDFPVSGADDSTQVSIEVHVHADPWVIDAVEARLDTVTVFSITSEYKEIETDIWLPIETDIELSFPDFEHDFSGGAAQALEMTKDPGNKGRITIHYSKYRVNKGIRDSFFNEADKVF